MRGATTRRIAERAGVNEVTMFRRFGIKSALIRAAIERQFECLQAQWTRYQADRPLRAKPVGALIPAFPGPIVMPWLIPEVRRLPA